MNGNQDNCAITVPQACGSYMGSGQPFWADPQLRKWNFLACLQNSGNLDYLRDNEDSQSFVSRREGFIYEVAPISPPFSNSYSTVIHTVEKITCYMVGVTPNCCATRCSSPLPTTWSVKFGSGVPFASVHERHGGRNRNPLPSSFYGTRIAAK